MRAFARGTQPEEAENIRTRWLALDGTLGRDTLCAWVLEEHVKLSANGRPPRTFLGHLDLCEDRLTAVRAGQRSAVTEEEQKELDDENARVIREWEMRNVIREDADVDDPAAE